MNITRTDRSCLLGLVLSAALTGCGDRGEDLGKLESIPVSEVPESVMKVAAEKLPGIEFEQAWKEVEEGGEVAYEIRGRDDRGKTRELKVTETGEVLEVE